MVQNICIDNLYAVTPRTVLSVGSCLHGRILVNLNTGYRGVATLCGHDAYETAAASYIKNTLAQRDIKPSAQQTAVGTNLHGAPALLNCELLEFEITVGHCCTMFV
jgi:hypothetical protein